MTAQQNNKSNSNNNNKMTAAQRVQLRQQQALNKHIKNNNKPTKSKRSVYSPTKPKPNPFQKQREGFVRPTYTPKRVRARAFKANAIPSTNYGTRLSPSQKDAINRMRQTNKSPQLQQPEELIVDEYSPSDIVVVEQKEEEEVEEYVVDEYSPVMIEGEVVLDEYYPSSDEEQEEEKEEVVEEEEEYEDDWGACIDLRPQPKLIHYFRTVNPCCLDDPNFDVKNITTKQFGEVVFEKIWVEEDRTRCNRTSMLTEEEYERWLLPEDAADEDEEEYGFMDVDPSSQNDPDFWCSSIYNDAGEVFAECPYSDEEWAARIAHKKARFEETVATWRRFEEWGDEHNVFFVRPHPTAK